MHVLLDSLSALIIVSAFALILTVTNVRQRQALVESTLFYDAVTETESFAQVVQRDFQGMSEVVSGPASSDSAFTFRGRIGADTTLHHIEYVREATVTGGGRSLYRIVRKVDGVEAGGSTDQLADWSIELRNGQGQPLADSASTDNVRQVFVRYEVAPSLDTTTTVQALVWQSTFHPPLRSEQRLF